jgi:hypothetical protein
MLTSNHKTNDQELHRYSSALQTQLFPFDKIKNQFKFQAKTLLNYLKELPTKASRIDDPMILLF